jgi:hypothetical protein
VHRFSALPELDHEPLEPSFLRSYIAVARRYEPHVTPELCESIAGTYVEMRQVCPALLVVTHHAVVLRWHGRCHSQGTYSKRLFF